MHQTVHAVNATFRKTRCYTNVVCCVLMIPPLECLRRCPTPPTPYGTAIPGDPPPPPDAPPRTFPPSPPKGASGQQLVGGVVGVQNLTIDSMIICETLSELHAHS